MTKGLGLCLLGRSLETVARTKYFWEGMELDAWTITKAPMAGSQNRSWPVIGYKLSLRESRPDISKCMIKVLNGRESRNATLLAASR